MFQLNTRYSFTMPQGTITQEGIRLIKTFIDVPRLHDDDWKLINPNASRSYLPNLPEDWQWQWVVTGKGEYVGTFPKRVSKYYWQEHGIKCPNSFVQGLGNIARQHSSDNITVSFDLTNRFNWSAGEFGDSGSCFWGDRSAARTILEENDALAIRFFEDDKGKGRAWIARLSDKRFIIFNGYGYTTLQIAQIFATWLGFSYKKIDLDNYGETSGIVYINSDCGYLIGTSEQCASIDAHDLRYACDDCYSCENCGDSIHGDNVYFSPDGEAYCQNCYYDHWRECDHCGNERYRDDMYYVESVGDVCESCIERHYNRCDNCGDYFANSEIVAIGDNCYCENCKPEESEEQNE